MYVMSPEEVEKAVAKWLTENYQFLDLEKAATKLAEIESKTNWLAGVRAASQISRTHMANKMGVTEAAYRNLEKQEIEGRISIRKLREAAAALDCELVYGLCPLDGRPFSRRFLDVIVPLSTPRIIPKFGYARINSMMDLMGWKFYDPNFRKAQGWSPNRSGEGRYHAKILKLIRLGGTN
jgi:transcriptional regulator with XRE-family HTH domain